MTITPEQVAALETDHGALCVWKGPDVWVITKYVQTFVDFEDPAEPYRTLASCYGHGMRVMRREAGEKVQREKQAARVRNGAVRKASMLKEAT